MSLIWIVMLQLAVCKDEVRWDEERDEITLFPTGLAAVKVSGCLPSFISASSCLAHLGSAVTYLEG